MKEVLKRFLFRAASATQRVLLYLYTALLVPVRPVIRRRPLTWVLGLTDVASMMRNISESLENVATVNFEKHPYYSFRYTVLVHNRRPILDVILKTFIAPALLAYFTVRARNFVYLGPNGFLFDPHGGRSFEFRFLKRRGRGIVCYFTGSDIRSIKLGIEHGESIGYEVLSKYMGNVYPDMLSERYDEERKSIAASADAFADVIVNAPVDQISYLQRETEPFLYFYPDSLFRRDEGKFDDLVEPIVLHAPSSPIIKGTQLVRAAVKKLSAEGYRFQYRELIGVPHEKVLEELASAHIVLNEFYSFVPGVFGVEAMAHGCALVTSADPAIEVSLGDDATDAWFITTYWQVYDHLKALLDDLPRAADYGERGFQWAQRFCSASQSRKRFLEYCMTADLVVET